MTWLPEASDPDNQKLDSSERDARRLQATLLTRWEPDAGVLGLRYQELGERGKRSDPDSVFAGHSLAGGALGGIRTPNLLIRSQML